MIDLSKKKILIIGGAGSIGSALVKEILTHKPAVVRIFDNSEEGLFHLKNELPTDNKLRFLVGDIRDKQRLKYAINDIDIVFHCAALKHVELCEYNPFEAVRTNVKGTQNIIDVCLDENVEQVILTSTDKAANPTNVMGTSKLLAEKLFIAANHCRGVKKTIFSCVRFGNVIGSSGSVIPLFKEQILKGGPLTITNGEMTRFIISLKDAVHLVVSLVDIARGGEVFLLKMPIVKIQDLADVLIEELSQSKKIEVKTIGLRPGEKSYEELMTDDESKRSIETEKLFIILSQLSSSEKAVNDYVGAKKLYSHTFNSNDSNPVTKKELKELLTIEGFL